ncbi:hypothetical protein QTP86_002542 [Hemibagrus guttatus]|nr:hypothetical protein QTP86_002542 [Hemibagrus guttatus]
MISFRLQHYHCRRKKEDKAWWTSEAKSKPLDCNQRLVYHNQTACLILQILHLGLDKHLHLLKGEEVNLTGVTPFYRSMLQTWRTILKTKRTVNENGDWALEEPLFFNPIIQTRLLSSASVRTVLIRNNVTKLGRFLDEYGWKPDEDLKVMTGLWSTRLISKMKEELFAVLPSSYRRTITRGLQQDGGTNQDFPKIMITPAISEEQQEELSGSILTFKTPNLGDFQLVSKTALYHISVKMIHLQSLRQQRALRWPGLLGPDFLAKGSVIHSLSTAYLIYSRVTGSLCLSQASLGIKVWEALMDFHRKYNGKLITHDIKLGVKFGKDDTFIFEVHLVDGHKEEEESFIVHVWGCGSIVVKDAASLPSAEDGPNRTFFVFVGTRSASLFIGGGDRRPHLPPSLPLVVFRPSRAEVIAQFDYASGDIARCCCSAVDVARLCCSAVDIARPSCSAVDVARHFCSAVDVVWDPLALPSCPSRTPACLCSGQHSRVVLNEASMPVYCSCKCQWKMESGEPASGSRAVQMSLAVC